ncbi:MAG: 4-hydroxybenzoate octaprenyltransferase [Nitrospirae bacterium]|nr:MAG: 4-hydroxybenzoate octaprenyltransferase [Nitrospirota bacterium]
MMSAALTRITLYLRMIKFSHSVFALPFALTAALIAASGIPTFRQVLWIVIAMVGARSGAMGLNRLIDREIDSANPRTAGRELPRGLIGVSETVLFIAVSFGVLILAASRLNPLCLKLSPVAILVLFLYSYTKRFTWASHFVLGLAISAGPIGAWIAVRGSFDAAILPLAAGVIFWLAGFDVLYALQDLDFDRGHGLYSIPRRFGIRRSLLLARAFHLITFLFLLLNGLLFHLGTFYWAGLAVVAGLFFYEHSLIREDDLSKLDVAFFTMNGYISMAVFFFTLLNYTV